MTPDSSPKTPALPSDASAVPRRRRKRDVIGLVAGVVTAASVVGLVLALAVGALFISGVIPLTGLQHYVAADLQKRLGAGWTVSANKAAIVRREGHAALEIRNAEFQHSSGLKLRAPDAEVRYDPWALMRGQVRISSIDIHGVNLRLQADKDGALTIDTGDGEVAINSPETDAPGVVERMGAMIAALLDNDTILPGLDRIALTGARLLLVDPDGKERAALEQVAIRLDRALLGRELQLTGRSVTGLKDVLFSSRTDASGERRVDVSVRAFRLDSLERLFLGPESSLLEGFPVAGDISLVSVPGAPKRLSGTIALGAGAIRSPDNPALGIGLDRTKLSFSGDASLQRIEVTTLDVGSGATDLVMQGVFARGEGTAWTLDGKAKGQIEGERGDPIQPLTAGTISIAGNGINRADLKTLTLEGPQLSVQGTGHAARTPEGPEVLARLRAAQSNVRSLFAAWPQMISPIIRRLLVERVEVGTVESLNLVLDMTPPALQAARVGEPTPDEAVNVEVVGSGVRFVIGEGIPKLHDVSLTARGTGRTLAVQARSARVDVPGSRQLALSDGAFTIADTWAERPIGQSSFRTQGNVDALAALLAMPALREAAPGQIDPDSVKGKVDLRSTLSLPLVEDIKASDVIVQSSGAISALSAEGLVGEETLEAGALAASYDRGSLNLRGEARIAGAPAQIDLKQDARGVGEAVLTMTVDQALRQRKGLAFGGGVSGPMPMRVVKPLGRRPDAPPRFEIDLTRAAIDGVLPGWTKPAGRPGKLSFALIEDDDKGPELIDIVLDASPVLLRGKASISADGQLDRAAFNPFRLSTGDDMRVDIRREGTVGKVSVRGAVADARPFLRALNGAGATQKNSPERGPPDVDLDLGIQILTGFNSEVIGNAALKLGLRGREVRQLEFSGRIGKAPLTVQQSRDAEGRLVRLRAEDGGAVLRYVDLYRRAYGGALSVDARPDEGGVSGELLFNNFSVRGEPALRRVLAEQFPQQARDGQRAADVGANVQFTRLKGGFVRTPTRFELRNGVIWGNEIGISAQGSIDYARDRADIAGTFVPGYALNNAFSKVPLLGPLLGGGQYEGLFAVNFRIAGAASAPTMSINPLSAIAPGIFRRFVDPFGGVPQGDLGAARP